VIREQKPHPLYKKVVQRRTRLKVHDEANSCGVGDRVQIMETRPLSKDKRWRLLEILEKAK
jgi:small subunit ribosomal protein S17